MDRRTYIETVAARNLTPESADLYVSHLRPAASLAHTTAADTGSHLGGRPTVDLAQWPQWDGRPLSLVATIDCADLANIDTGLDLPADGTLSFFYAADEDRQPWGLYLNDEAGWQVVYTAPGAGVELTPPPATLEFPRIPLTASSTTSTPGMEEVVVDTIWKLEGDGFFAVVDELDAHRSNAAKHQVGGWPHLVQGPFWLEASDGIDGIPRDERGSARERWSDRRRGTRELALLLQLDTDDDAGWMWGDCGTLYFTIRRSDLAARRFDRVWLTLQCT